MTITVDDVKLLKSQRLTDEADGGGRATGEAIVDNEINNLFPDISRLDRTLGRINLRKVFAGVITENQDRYLGAHAIITRKPGDDLVHALLFNTDSQTDERAEAQSFIEGYVVPSIAADWELLGDQFAGQRALSGVQFEWARIPETGDVYQLVDGGYNQFVRIESVEHEMRTYLYNFNGQYVTFQRRYLNIGISSALLRKYPGGTPTPTGTTDQNLDGNKKSRVNSTQVADTARYYGISALKEGLSAGSLQLDVKSVYSQLVPSAIKENALVDQIAGSRRRYNIAASTAPRTVPVQFVSIGSGHSATYLTTGCTMGSLSITLGSTVYKDNRAGELVVESGSAIADRITIDYETGRLDAYRAAGSITSTGNATYTIGATATGQTVTGLQEIGLANRGFAYTFNLSEAKPRPGTLVISYMALGRWYELRDYGNGELLGEGTGSVDFATGSCSVTLNALPDVNTSIVFAFVCQDDFNFVVHSGSVDQPKAVVEYKLPHTLLKPASLTVSSIHGGVTKTMTSNTAGVLTGAAGTGRVNWARGVIALEFLATIDQGTEITVSYDVPEDAVDEEMTVIVDGDGMVTGTIPGAPLTPGLVSARWAVERAGRVPTAGEENYSANVEVAREVTDDGSGAWVGFDGTIDYATGAFTLRAGKTYDKYETVIQYEEIS